MKLLSRRILILLPLLTMLALGAWARQEAVRYYQHEWVNDPIQGKYRLTNVSSRCTSYKVLDANTSLSASKDFGDGAPTRKGIYIHNGRKIVITKSIDI